MNDQQFLQFLDELREYLQQPNVFVTDIDRARDFYSAVSLAKELFGNGNVEIRNDPLQTGAMFIHVEVSDIVMRGVREIKDFSDLISLADNFEIYPLSDEEVCFAAVFRGVNKKI